VNLTRLLAGSNHRVSFSGGIASFSQIPVENCRVGDSVPIIRGKRARGCRRVGCSIDPDSPMHSKWKDPLSAHLGQSRLRLLAAPSTRHDTNQRRLISSRELRIVKFRFIFPQSSSSNCNDDYAPLGGIVSSLSDISFCVIIRTIVREQSNESSFTYISQRLLWKRFRQKRDPFYMTLNEYCTCQYKLV